MITESERIGIIAVDGSPDSIELVQFATRSLHPSWKWLLVHVIDLAAPAHPDALDGIAAHASDLMTQAQQLLPDTTPITETSPDIAEGLRTVARTHRASLLLLGGGTRGPLASALLGSVNRDLMRDAPCPVLTLTTPTEDRPASPNTHSP